MSRVYRVQCRTWPVAPSYVAGVRRNVVDTWVLIPEKVDRAFAILSGAGSEVQNGTAGKGNGRRPCSRCHRGGVDNENAAEEGED